MHYYYCPECGNKLINKQAGDDGLTPFCENCNKFWFDSFSTCVIILVTNEFDEVVLLKQSYLSDKYCTLVAGYMIPGENAENAARREVKEEIGVELKSLNYAGSYWFEQKNLLMVGFIGQVNKCKLTLSKEVDSAFWVKWELVPDYIFPEHPDNAAYAIYKTYVNQIILGKELQLNN